MGTLMTFALLMLAAFDPAGWYVYAPYKAITTVSSSLHQQGYDCYARWDSSGNSITCDSEAIRQRYTGAISGDARNAYIKQACLLAHEAEHLKLRTSSEEYPLLREYVCLDRLGAPQWMKDEVYDKLPRSAPVYVEDED